MSPETISTLAKEIAAQIGGTPYAFYGLVLLISFVAGGLGAYVGAYFKKRGEQSAIQTDFDAILGQLKETTRLTEEIKAGISGKQAEELAMRALLRTKLEALMECSYELELWLEQARSKACEGDMVDINRCPIGRMESLQAIYFRDIAGPTAELKIAVLHSNRFTLELAGQMSPLKRISFGMAKEKAEQQKLADATMEKLLATMQEIIKTLGAFRTTLISTYSKRCGL